MRLACTFSVLVLALMPVSTRAQQHIYPDCWPAWGIFPDPDIEVAVTFARLYTGNYNTGKPYDYVTISPNGNGETFADMGITIRFRIACHRTGWPIVQIPAEKMILFSSSLCLCTYPTAAYPTDADGWTEFTGTIVGGGCAQSLDFYVDGIHICSDFNESGPPTIDAGDVAFLATMLGAACP